MTAAALVIANATSTKNGSSSYSPSKKYNDAPSAQVFPPQSTTSTASSRPVQKTVATPDSTPAIPNVNDKATMTVTRSIDRDIRAAFEDAIKVARAVPDPEATEITEGEPEAPRQLPTLETRAVSSSPRIFDEPIDAKAQPEGITRERVRTFTDLNLREGPDPAYLKVETLANGTILFVLEKNGKWWRVQSATSGVEGWINGTFVKPAD
ncbi:SH3 domain-containing protein [Neorhizobium sp. BT27B]|uniref:SH3 domain-containing protein n=1 Tax=Neorhizobium sp. BT27B TaxID=3142625 RepID=UPI003D2E6E4E